jgi:hypothetical protein
MGKSSGKFLLTLVLTVFLAMFSWGPAAGATNWTNAGEGDWNDPLNWLPPSVPDAGTDAFINNGGTAKIVNGDASAKNLTLGDTSGTSGSVKLINDYQLNIPRYLTVGNYGDGSFYQMDGVSVASVLYLGHQPSGQGSYFMEKGLLTVGKPSSGSIQVGDSGTGLFQQTGGEVVTSYLSLGDNPGAQGTYLLEQGLLTTNGYFYIGRSGNGSFIQKGGAVLANYIISMGSQPGSLGDYSLKKGTLTVGQENNGQTFVVGSKGTGTFHQEDGAVTIYGGLITPGI